MMKSFLFLFSILVAVPAFAQTDAVGVEVYLKENDRTYTYYVISEVHPDGSLKLYQPFTGTSVDVAAADVPAQRVFPLDQTTVTIDFFGTPKSLDLQKRKTVISRRGQLIEPFFLSQIFSDGALYLYHAPTSTYSVLTPAEVSTNVLESVQTHEALEVGKTVTIRSLNRAAPYATYNILGIYSDGSVQVEESRSKKISSVDFKNLRNAVTTAASATLDFQIETGTTPKAVVVGSAVVLKEPSGDYADYVVTAIYSDGGIEFEPKGKVGAPRFYHFAGDSSVFVEALKTLQGFTVSETIYLKDISGRKRYDTYKVNRILGNGMISLQGARKASVILASTAAPLRLKSVKQLKVNIQGVKGPVSYTATNRSAFWVRNAVTNGYADGYVTHVFTDGSIGITGRYSDIDAMVSKPLLTTAEFEATAVVSITDFGKLKKYAVFAMSDPLTGERLDYSLSQAYSDGNGTIQQVVSYSGEQVDLTMVEQTAILSVPEVDGFKPGIYIETLPDGSEEAYAVPVLFEDSTARGLKVKSQSTFYSISWSGGQVYEAKNRFMATSDLAKMETFCTAGESASNCERRFMQDRFPLLKQPATP